MVIQNGDKWEVRSLAGKCLGQYTERTAAEVHDRRLLEAAARRRAWYGVVGVTMGILGIISLAMYSFPRYGIWRMTLAGQGELRRAEWNRQIAVREAEAKMNAATALAEAEVARAKGVAEANRIIGHSLHENEAYLRYLWIQGLAGSEREVVYVPTEANLPILEASRLARQKMPIAKE